MQSNQQIFRKQNLQLVAMITLVVTYAECVFSQTYITEPIEYKNKIGLKLMKGRIGDTQIQPLHEYKTLMDFGISYDRKIHRFIRIESGLLYVRKQSFYHATTNPDSTLAGSFYNLRLPALFRMECKYFYASAGFYVDLMFENSAKHNYYDESIENGFSKSRFKPGICTHIGIQIPVIDKFLLFAETGVSSDLSSLITSNHRGSRFSGYGFSLGMSYRF